MPRRGQTRAADLAVAERRQYVFSLRRTGATYEAIYQAARRRFGETLPRHYNRWKVHQDVVAELTQLRTALALDVEAVRALELDRLDQLQLAVWPLALGRPADLERGLPAQPPDFEASRQVLAIQARRAKYVPGLEVPAKIAPTTPDGQEPWESAGGLAALLQAAHAPPAATNGHTQLPAVDESA